jgi:hypothetical protein
VGIGTAVVDTGFGGDTAGTAVDRARGVGSGCNDLPLPLLLDTPVPKQFEGVQFKFTTVWTVWYCFYGILNRSQVLATADTLY